MCGRCANPYCRVVLLSAHAVIADSIIRCKSSQNTILPAKPGTDGKQIRTSAPRSDASARPDTGVQHLARALEFCEAILRGVTPLLVHSGFTEVFAGAREAVDSGRTLAHSEGPLPHTCVPCSTELSSVLRNHSCRGLPSTCKHWKTSKRTTWLPLATRTDWHIRGEPAPLSAFAFSLQGQRTFDLLELLTAFSAGSKILARQVGCECSVHVEKQLIRHAQSHTCKFRPSTRVTPTDSLLGRDGSKLNWTPARETRSPDPSEAKQAGLVDNFPTLLSGTHNPIPQVSPPCEEAMPSSLEFIRHKEDHTDKLTGDHSDHAADDGGAGSVADDRSTFCGAGDQRGDRGQELQLWVVGNEAELLVLLNTLFAALLEAAPPGSCLKLVVAVSGQNGPEKCTEGDSGRLGDAGASILGTADETPSLTEPGDRRPGIRQAGGTGLASGESGPSLGPGITTQNGDGEAWIPVTFDFCLTVREQNGSAENRRKFFQRGHGVHITGASCNARWA